MAMQLGRCYEAWMLSIAANGMPPQKKNCEAFHLPGHYLVRRCNAVHLLLASTDAQKYAWVPHAQAEQSWSGLRSFSSEIDLFALSPFARALQTTGEIQERTLPTLIREERENPFLMFFNKKLGP